LIATESAAHVVLATAVLDAMVAHARQDAPDECCGLLVGSANRIDESVRTLSLERSPNRYQVDPAAHFALIRRLRGTDRAIIGAYHSHPRSAAEPSPSDLREAYDSELVYVIVSLAGVEPEVRAWKIAEGVVVELRIRQA
jgi:proteasome lid subunit RPN8/RPN11